MAWNRSALDSVLAPGASNRDTTVNQSLYSQKTPYVSPSWTSYIYGASVVSIVKETDQLCETTLYIVLAVHIEGLVQDCSISSAKTKSNELTQ